MRYRKVSVHIWNDEKFRTLSDDSQLLFIFILTHPHMTSLGAMRATQEGLAAEKGWKRERVSKGFQELSRNGLLIADNDASFVCLPNFIKHNQPENPNVVKSWQSALETIPECNHKYQLIQQIESYVLTLSKPFQKAFETLSKPFRKSMPNQEPEPEPEQEQDPPNPPRGADAAEASFELFWQAYPRHTKKAAAFKSWQQIKPEEIEPILAALSWQTKQPGWVKENGKYIPHPSTWLNDRRWEDEPPQAVKPKPNEPEDDLNRSLRMMREQGDDWGETQNG
jgi:hypothetical protein